MKQCDNNFRSHILMYRTMATYLIANISVIVKISLIVAISFLNNNFYKLIFYLFCNIDLYTFILYTRLKASIKF